MELIITRDRDKTVLISGCFTQQEFDLLKTDSTKSHQYLSTLDIFIDGLYEKGYNSFLFHQWSYFSLITASYLHSLKQKYHDIILYGIFDSRNQGVDAQPPEALFNEVMYLDQEGISLQEADKYRKLMDNAYILLYYYHYKDPQGKQVLEAALEQAKLPVNLHSEFSI